MDTFAIKVPLKHILSILRVADIVQGDFCCAMERIDHETAVCFFFTQVNNFMFLTGVAQVLFEDAQQLRGRHIMCDTQVNQAKAKKQVKSGHNQTKIKKEVA